MYQSHGKDVDSVHLENACGVSHFPTTPATAKFSKSRMQKKAGGCAASQQNSKSGDFYHKHRARPSILFKVTLQSLEVGCFGQT